MLDYSQNQRILYIVLGRAPGERGNESHSQRREP